MQTEKKAPTTEDMQRKAEAFAKYHDDHAKYGGASYEFHARAATFLRDTAEQVSALQARVAELERRHRSIADKYKCDVANFQEKVAGLTDDRDALRAQLAKEKQAHADDVQALNESNAERRSLREQVEGLLDAVAPLAQWARAVCVTFPPGAISPDVRPDMLKHVLTLSFAQRLVAALSTLPAEEKKPVTPDLFTGPMFEAMEKVARAAAYAGRVYERDVAARIVDRLGFKNLASVIRAGPMLGDWSMPTPPAQ